MTETASPIVTWTSKDRALAQAQGWNLFEINAQGTCKTIQRCAEANVFADDAAALAFVQAQAEAGVEHAIKAIELDARLHG